MKLSRRGVCIQVIFKHIFIFVLESSLKSNSAHFDKVRGGGLLGRGERIFAFKDEAFANLLSTDIFLNFKSSLEVFRYLFPSDLLL